MSQPFTWIVAFTVDIRTVAAGFELTDAAAKLLDPLIGDDARTAVVLHMPNAAHIANARGLTLGVPGREPFIEALRAACPKAGTLQSALLMSRAILQSPDVVRTGIDVEPTIQAIESALVELVGELP